MMEKRSLLQVSVELYKCLMLTVVALLLLFILSAYEARTPRTQWTQTNPMPVEVVNDVFGKVEVTNPGGGRVNMFNPGLGRRDGVPLKVEVENWPSRLGY